MNLLVLVLAAHPFLQSFQDSDGNETRFHRVHLTNGNFVDGQLIKDTPGLVLLRIRSGEMGIRRDQIERVEFVKMRDRWQPPDRTPVRPPPTGVKTPTDPNPPTDPKNPKNPIADKTPAEIRKRIDMIVWKLRTTPGIEKSFNVEELKALGDEGAMYLASRTADVEVGLQPALSAALINLKNPKVVPIMEEFLSHESAKVRTVAVAVIALLADEATKIKDLRPLLRDPDGSVRGTVIGMLTNVNEPEWIDAMADLCADKIRDVRTQALTTISKLALKHGQQEKAIRYLVSNLRDSDDGVRCDNASTIGGLGRPDAWSHLTPVLADPEPKVRAAVAQALFQLGSAEAGPDIVAQMARERDRWTRTYLAQCAQRMKLTAAIEHLIEWLGDPEDDIKKISERVLQALTGQNLGTDKAAWLDWYQKSK
jgi:HEAT repeat protein